MRSYRHLSEDERDQIGIWRAAGRSVGAIARALGRAKATISRELQRKRTPLGWVFAASRRRSLSIAQAA
jgi:IS30 family transposase